MTPALVKELREKLRFLEHQTFTNVFQNPNFPHLNSSISGSVDQQSIPTWYTSIQDILENVAVEYDMNDIEAGQFLEMKLNLSPDSLNVYFLIPNKNQPTIRLVLAVEVSDIERGTFRFQSPLIKEMQFNHDILSNHAA